MFKSFAGPILAGVFLLAALVPPAAATGPTLPPPTGPVVLSVTGNITTTNAAGRADFDRAMLEALGLTTLTTWTPWTDGQVPFEGVLGSALVEAVGARGTTVRAIAVNDYAADVPVSDFRDYGVLLAMRMAGTQLRLRDKGRIWIIFPWTAHPELDNDATRMKSVWQIRQLVIQ